MTKFQILFVPDPMFDNYRLAFFVNSATNPGAGGDEWLCGTLSSLADELAEQEQSDISTCLRRGAEIIRRFRKPNKWVNEKWVNETQKLAVRTSITRKRRLAYLSIANTRPQYPPAQTTTNQRNCHPSPPTASTSHHQPTPSISTACDHSKPPPTPSTSAHHHVATPPMWQPNSNLSQRSPQHHSTNNHLPRPQLLSSSATHQTHPPTDQPTLTSRNKAARHSPPKQQISRIRCEIRDNSKCPSTTHHQQHPSLHNNIPHHGHSTAIATHHHDYTPKPTSESPANTTTGTMPNDGHPPPLQSSVTTTKAYQHPPNHSPSPFTISSKGQHHKYTTITHNHPMGNSRRSPS